MVQLITCARNDGERGGLGRGGDGDAASAHGGYGGLFVVQAGLAGDVGGDAHGSQGGRPAPPPQQQPVTLLLRETGVRAGDGC